jgi:hypothetical protein
LQLAAPEKLGKYDVVYWAGDTELARQSFEMVDVAASLEAPGEVEGGLFFDVGWKAEGNRGDRIDLFSAKSPEPIAWNYPIRGNPVQIQSAGRAAEPRASEIARVAPGLVRLSEVQLRGSAGIVGEKDCETPMITHAETPRVGDRDIGESWASGFLPLIVLEFFVASGFGPNVFFVWPLLGALGSAVKQRNVTIRRSVLRSRCSRGSSASR